MHYNDILIFLTSTNDRLSFKTHCFNYVVSWILFGLLIYNKVGFVLSYTITMMFFCMISLILIKYWSNPLPSSSSSDWSQLDITVKI